MVNAKKILQKKPPVDKEFEREKTAFTLKFLRLMVELGLYNKMSKTYRIYILKKYEYGYFCHIYREPGLTFKDLNAKLSEIQEGLNCIWDMKIIQWEDYAEVKIVLHPLNMETPFENPNIKPWEMFLGWDLTKKPIINDCNKKNMMLFAGKTGGGKTTLLYMILLSYIMSCTPQEVEIYLCDIAKNEFCLFQKIPHIRLYCTELEELLEMARTIRALLIKRKKMIAKYREKGFATNIKEYNEYMIKTKQLDKILSYCYLIIDEFSILAPDKSDLKEEKETKEEIIDVLKKVSKLGRSLGVFNVICLQKTSKEEMFCTIIKNMSSVRLSFAANDYASSDVIIGDGSAVGLPDRYAVFSQNGGEDKHYTFSPFLSTEMLAALLKPYMTRKPEQKKITSRHIPKQPTEYNPDVACSASRTIYQIDTKLKPAKNISYERIKPVENKVLILKGGDYIDY